MSGYLSKVSKKMNKKTIRIKTLNFNSDDGKGYCVIHIVFCHTTQMYGNTKLQFSLFLPSSTQMSLAI